MTPQELEIAVLLAFDQIVADDGTATIGDIRRVADSDDDAADVAQRLTDRGLLRRGQSLIGDYSLTLEGKQAVQDIKDRRNNRQRRRSTCRQQVLAWLDGQGPVGSPADPKGFSGSVDGVPFTEDEVNEAVDYLVDKGLAASLGHRTASGHWHVVAITRLGSDCVDDGGDIAAYLSRLRQVAHPVNQVFNMAGTGNTFATAAADGATASATVNNTFNLEGAHLFAAMIRAAEADLDLTQEARATLAELEATDDPTIARRAANVLYQFVSGTAAGTAGQVLGVYGANLLGLQ